MVVPLLASGARFSTHWTSDRVAGGLPRCTGATAR
jgi:hypothetical protein